MDNNEHPNFLDLLEPPVHARPPRKEDVLFRADVDWTANACLGGSFPEYAYRAGFRLAARHLAEQVCETANDQDLLVYPIVYLYRHHIEMMLKHAIQLASRVLDQELVEHDFKTLGKHNLVDLWKAARPRLLSAWEITSADPLPQEDLDGIESYIAQVDAHDPDGQRFRYATAKSRDGRQTRGAPAYVPSLKPELTHINIRVIAEAMERLADYLERMDDWLFEWVQWKWEMESDAY